MQLSVITATWQRPKHLAACTRQFSLQSRGDLRCEHLIVSDGADPTARHIAVEAGARFCHLPEHFGRFGVAAKDEGIRQATGDYVCFWDDDNQFDPHALTTLYSAAAGSDIGVVRVRHLDRPTGRFITIPRVWNGQFVLGDVDTLCACVRRELALKCTWTATGARENTDFHWLTALAAHAPTIRFVPVIVGSHL